MNSTNSRWASALNHPPPTGASRGRAAPDRSLTKRRCLTGLIALFVASRLVYAAVGVRFSTSPLVWFYQYISPSLLRDHLWSSVWYSHTQPPGFNLFLGLVLRYSPWPPGVSFQFLYLAFGLCMLWGLVELFDSLGVDRRIACAVVALYVCGPDVVLYENWLFYEYPVAVGLVVALAFLARYQVRARLVDVLAFVVIATGLALTRASFHPFWLAFVVVVALVSQPNPRRLRLAAIALLPLLLVGTIVVKNQVRYGQPTLSTWFGMNAAKATVPNLSPERRFRLVAEGRLSRYTLVPMFDGYSAYQKQTGLHCSASGEPPVVAEPTKNAFANNFNYRCYLPIYERLQHDALVAVEADPLAFVRGTQRNVMLSLRPSGNYRGYGHNVTLLWGFVHTYQSVVLLTPSNGAVPTLGLAPPDKGTTDALTHVSMVMLVGLAAATFDAFRQLSIWIVERRRPHAVRLVMSATCVFTTLVTSMFESGENQRFKIAIEPLLIIYAVLAAQWAVAAVFRLRPRYRHPAEA